MYESISIAWKMYMTKTLQLHFQQNRHILTTFFHKLFQQPFLCVIGIGYIFLHPKTAISIRLGTQRLQCTVYNR